MPVKRRGQVTRAEIVLSNWQQEELGGFSGRRQPSMGGTSRVTGDGHARICEGLGVKVLIDYLSAPVLSCSFAPQESFVSSSQHAVARVCCRDPRRQTLSSIPSRERLQNLSR